MVMKIGRRQRHLANTLGHYARPTGALGFQGADIGSVVRGMRSRPGLLQRDDGSSQRVMMHEDLLNEGRFRGGTVTESLRDGRGHTITAANLSDTSGTQAGSTGFGQSMSKVDRFNPVYDDLSRGTVAEDWIPRDPRLQNRMFRMMFARGAIEGPVVETIAELCWSDFEFAGIRDKTILDTYMAAKEAVKPERFLPFITTEYLVVGRVVVQFVLDPVSGIWVDMVIHNSDYIEVGDMYRTGFMPKLDLLPSPDLQRWVKSNDPRDVEARKGLPKTLLDQFSQNKPVPLDPTVTAYLPRRSFFNDISGTSFYVRNIPLWGLEKSLINATLTGHRRRSGPITQIAVGSENWEPNPEQIDALVSAYTAAEEDSVSSTIGTRFDVQFNQIRGGLQEMWKWEDEFDFLQNMKLRMFGVSEQLLTGDFNIDTTTAPTTFLERLKAHRKYVTEGMILQKFCRGLAQVHNFRHRSQAELSHRIRVEGDDHDLMLPTVVFARNLDTAADTARADLLDKMEEKGLPVGLAEWNRTLGGGELMDRMRTAVEDLEFRVKYAKFQAIKKQVDDLVENADEKVIQKRSGELIDSIHELKFARDDDPFEVAELSKKGKQRAEDVAENKPDDEPNVSSSSVIRTRDTRVNGNKVHDLSIDRISTNRDRGTLSSGGKAY